MPRAPSEIVQYKLRIRESLRRRIEAAAKKRQVSANYEMASRLERSFDQESQRSLDKVAGDIEVSWLRFGQAFHDLAVGNGVLDAIDVLVAAIESGKDVPKAIDAVKQAKRVIEIKRLMALRNVRNV